jgi:hypothetical protein
LIPYWARRSIRELSRTVFIKRKNRPQQPSLHRGKQISCGSWKCRKMQAL